MRGWLARAWLVGVLALVGMGCGDDGEDPGPPAAIDAEETSDEGAIVPDAPAPEDIAPDVGDTGPPPVEGDTCTPPFVVDAAALPWSTQTDLVGAADDFHHGPSACGDAAPAGGAGNPDHVYAFTPKDTAHYPISVTTDAGSAARVYVVTECDNIVAGTCLGTAKQLGAGDAALMLELEGGLTYFIVVDSDGGVLAPDFAYTLTVGAPCFPSCDGKECGDDGCGGECGPCGAGHVCDTDQSCFEIPGTCAVIDTVACDSTVAAEYDNVSVHASDAFDSYSCDVAAGKDFSKAWELIWRLAPDVDQLVTVAGEDQPGLRVTALAAVDGACVDNGESCLAHAGANGLEFLALGGQEYFLVWDSLAADPIVGLGFEIACCAPQCADKTCGPDGCGGLCGAGICDTGACVEGECVPVGESCTPLAAVECNAPGAPPTEVGPASNMIAGVTQAFSDYTCKVGAGDYTAAAEATWSLTAPADVLVTVTGDGAGVHLAVLRDQGNGCEDTEESCEVAGKTGATFELAADDTAYLVWDSAAGPYVDAFTFEVNCCYPTCDPATCGSDGCGGTCACAEGKLCDAGACTDPQPGDLCEVPLIIDTFPAVITADTAGFHDLYALVSGTCDAGIFGATGADAPDMVYALVPTETGPHQIDVETAGGFNSAVYVVTDCGDIANTCIDTDDGIFGDSLSLTLQAGTAYFLIVDGSGAGQSGAFTMTITAPCTPNCTDKGCGSDGCGGSCGTCDLGSECTEGGVCEAAPTECVAAQEVVCGDSLADLSLSGAGATFAFASYPCQPGAVDYGQSTELTLSFTPEEDALVAVTLTGAEQADIIVLSDTGGGCEATEDTCLLVGEGGAQFEAEGGVTYYLVLDGAGGAPAGSVGLSVACASGGESCDDPIEVGSLPATLTGDTSLGYTDKLSGAACTPDIGGAGQPDVIYALTPDTDGAHTFDLDYQLLASPGVLYLLTDCADAGSCLAGKDFFPGAPINGGPLTVELVAGTTYWVVVDSANNAEIGQYTLSIAGP